MLAFVPGFFDALWSYLRPKGEGKGYDDVRPTTVAQFIRLDPKDAIEMMEPHDIAAIFSGVMAGTARPPVLEILADLKGKDRERRLALMLNDTAAIAYTVDPARADVLSFVERLRSAKGGAVFLAKVAICLAEGSRDPRVRIHLFTPNDK